MVNGRTDALDDIIADCDYESVPDTLIAFWLASLTNQMSEFNFEDAFSLFIKISHAKLAEHGVLTFDEYWKSEDSSIIRYNPQLNAALSYIAEPKLGLTTAYLTRELAGVVYKKVRERYATIPVYVKMHDLYRRVRHHVRFIHNHSVSENAILFDECIHSVHSSGGLWDEHLTPYHDIETIRMEAESIYNQLVHLD